MLRYFHYWIFNKFSKTQHTQRFPRRRTVQSAVREMAPQNTRTADDKLAKWVFGIARIFGYWMFNEETTRNNRLKRAKTTAGAWLRVLITLVIYSLFLWFQIHYSPGSYIHRPTNGTKLLLLSFNVRLMSTMLSVSMNIWNRHNLLEIISINQEFDNEVSIYEYHLNMIIIHAMTKQKNENLTDEVHWLQLAPTTIQKEIYHVRQYGFGFSILHINILLYTEYSVYLSNTNKRQNSAVLDSHYHSGDFEIRTDSSIISIHVLFAQRLYETSFVEFCIAQCKWYFKCHPTTLY